MTKQVEAFIYHSLTQKLSIVTFKLQHQKRNIQILVDIQSHFTILTHPSALPSPSRNHVNISVNCVLDRSFSAHYETVLLF